jgi:hypothetical protein
MDSRVRILAKLFKLWSETNQSGSCNIKYQRVAGRTDKAERSVGHKSPRYLVEGHSGKYLI